MAGTGGCRAAPGAIIEALAWTAAAGAFSAANRATGGCYAHCTPGTFCNPDTGLCERVPCDGKCVNGERCEVKFEQERCVAKEGPALRFERNSESPVPTSTVSP